MKKIVLVCSHKYSGSGALVEAMNQNLRIQKYKFGRYSHPLNLLALTEEPHKMNNRSSIYLDELLNNHELGTKVAYKECKFIYVVRSPEATLNLLVKNDGLAPIFAARYYAFRLRRICEMAKRTPGAVLLTWDNLLIGRGITLIDEYLELKTPISFNPLFLAPYNYKFDINLGTFLSETESAWEKYLFFLKNQNLKYCS